MSDVLVLPSSPHKHTGQRKMETWSFLHHRHRMWFTNNQDVPDHWWIY